MLSQLLKRLRQEGHISLEVKTSLDNRARARKERRKKKSVLVTFV
jgi:hypothetical protein